MSSKDCTNDFINDLLNNEDDVLYKYFQSNGEYLSGITIDNKVVFKHIKNLKEEEMKNSFIYYLMARIIHNGIKHISGDRYCFHLQKSADMGNSLANLRLAMLYRGKSYHYFNDYVRDDKKAVYYYLLSAEKGNASAQNNLGIMYCDGSGVERNYERAFYYFSLSAEQNSSRAYNNLGDMYLKGEYVDVDYEKAFYYFQLSAKQGNRYGCGNLKKLIENWDGYFDCMLKIGKKNDKDFNELKKEITKLRERNKQLEDEIVELKYRPDGIGYLEAKEHFTALKN